MSRNNSLLFLISLSVSLSVMIFILYGDIWPEPAMRSEAALVLAVLTILIAVLAFTLIAVERAERLPHRITTRAETCLVPIEQETEQEEEETVEIKSKMPGNFQQTL